jgi:hypothetical protein
MMPIMHAQTRSTNKVFMKNGEAHHGASMLTWTKATRFFSASSVPGLAFSAATKEGNRLWPLQQHLPDFRRVTLLSSWDQMGPEYQQ